MERFVEGVSNKLERESVEWGQQGRNNRCDRNEYEQFGYKQKRMISDQILKQKYEPSYDLYISKPINELLSNVPTRHVVLFKEYLFLDDENEYFKRYYYSHEHFQRILKLLRFYENVFPPPTPNLCPLDIANTMTKRNQILAKIYCLQANNGKKSPLAELVSSPNGIFPTCALEPQLPALLSSTIPNPNQNSKRNRIQNTKEPIEQVEEQCIGKKEHGLFRIQNEVNYSLEKLQTKGNTESISHLQCDKKLELVELYVQRGECGDERGEERGGGGRGGGITTLRQVQKGLAITDEEDFLSGINYFKYEEIQREDNNMFDRDESLKNSGEDDGDDLEYMLDKKYKTNQDIKCDQYSQIFFKTPSQIKFDNECLSDLKFQMDNEVSCYQQEEKILQEDLDLDGLRHEINEFDNNKRSGNSKQEQNDNHLWARHFLGEEQSNITNENTFPDEICLNKLTDLQYAYKEEQEEGNRLIEGSFLGELKAFEDMSLSFETNTFDIYNPSYSSKDSYSCNTIAQHQSERRLYEEIWNFSEYSDLMNKYSICDKNDLELGKHALVQQSCSPPAGMCMYQYKEKKKQQPDEKQSSRAENVSIQNPLNKIRSIEHSPEQIMKVTPQLVQQNNSIYEMIQAHIFKQQQSSRHKNKKERFSQEVATSLEGMKQIHHNNVQSVSKNITTSATTMESISSKKQLKSIIPNAQTTINILQGVTTPHSKQEQIISSQNLGIVEKPFSSKTFNKLQLLQKMKVNSQTNQNIPQQTNQMNNLAQLSISLINQNNQKRKNITTVYPSNLKNISLNNSNNQINPPFNVLNSKQPNNSNNQINPVIPLNILNSKQPNNSNNPINHVNPLNVFNSKQPNNSLNKINSVIPLNSKPPNNPINHVIPLNSKPPNNPINHVIPLNSKPPNNSQFMANFHQKSDINYTPDIKNSLSSQLVPQSMKNTNKRKQKRQSTSRKRNKNSSKNISFTNQQQNKIKGDATDQHLKSLQPHIQSSHQDSQIQYSSELTSHSSSPQKSLKSGNQIQQNQQLNSRSQMNLMNSKISMNNVNLIGYKQKVTNKFNGFVQNEQEQSVRGSQNLCMTILKNRKTTDEKKKKEHSQSSSYLQMLQNIEQQNQSSVKYFRHSLDTSDNITTHPNTHYKNMASTSKETSKHNSTQLNIHPFISSHQSSKSFHPLPQQYLTSKSFLSFTSLLHIDTTS